MPWLLQPRAFLLADSSLVGLVTTSWISWADKPAFCPRLIKFLASGVTPSVKYAWRKINKCDINNFTGGLLYIMIYTVPGRFQKGMEWLTQFPASNDENIFIFVKNWHLWNCITEHRPSTIFMTFQPVWFVSKLL